MGKAHPPNLLYVFWVSIKNLEVRNMSLLGKQILIILHIFMWNSEMGKNTIRTPERKKKKVLGILLKEILAFYLVENS